MFILYIIACIPLIIGAILWLVTHKVSWWEWLIGTAIGFATAGIIHVIAVNGLTGDFETWSGKVKTAVYMPKWVETYQEAVYKTVTKTRYNSSTKRSETYTERVFSHYETRYRTHGPDWWVETDFGKKSPNYDINETKYGLIVGRFGDEGKRVGRRPGYYSGDRNDYYAININNHLMPVTLRTHFENRTKAAPSMFSFVEVPTNIAIYEYPANKNIFASDRLLGTAKEDFNLLEFDRMNTRLGPTKKVNVIIIGFGDKSSMLGKYQQSKWWGGKKNDLVICYGNDWTSCFGWTEKELVKRNLETLFLDNKPNTSLIPKIEKEIIDNYEIKDWSKFDYIAIEPPRWAFIVMLIVLFVTQGGFWTWAYLNEHKGLSIFKKD